MKYTVVIFVFFLRSIICVPVVEAQADLKLIVDSVQALVWGNQISAGIQLGLENLAMVKEHAEDTLYADLEITIGFGYQFEFKYEKARECFSIGNSIYENKYGNNHIKYAETLNHLAYIEQKIGLYQNAKEKFEKVLSIRQRVLGRDHPHCGYSLDLLSGAYLDIGMFREAERYTLQALELRKKQKETHAIEYLYSLNNTAKFYHKVGRYSHAAQYFEECTKLAEDLKGNNSTEYVIASKNLAATYLHIGKQDASDSLFAKLDSLTLHLFSADHPNYREISMYKARMLTRKNFIYRADSTYKSLLNWSTSAFGASFPKTLLYREELANSQVIQNKYDSARVNYDVVLNLLEERSGKANPSYLLILTKKCYLLYLQNDLVQLEALINEGTKITLSLFDSYFEVLSESEKIAFYNSMRADLNFYAQSYVEIASKNPKVLENLYNSVLATKAIILNSNKKMAKMMAESKDSVLLAHYQNWQTARLNWARSVPSQKLSKQEKDSLEQLVSNTERTLREYAYQNNQDLGRDKASFKEVKQTLKKGEIAIEILRIKWRHLLPSFRDSSDVTLPSYQLFSYSDSIAYYALLVYPDQSIPKLVYLGDQSLETTSLVFHQNSIQFFLEDLRSYQAYWGALEKYLKGCKKVYISPDGVYNQININTLYHPQKKKWLLELLDIELLTNTRELLWTFNKGKESNFTAALFGDPTFDLLTKNPIEGINEQPTPIQTRAFSRSQLTQLTQLSGTRKEIDQIFEILTKERYQVQRFINQDATEEQLKNTRNPEILHIATHGFFDSEKGNENEAASLLHSGIILAGASTFEKMNDKPEGEDGVLTAFEAMDLSLENTKLVVMSACETGLGKIREGEGVYGLQRAFRVAGAQCLLYSLWKVNDHSTQELMNIFYENISMNMSKRDAFKAAQLKLKKKYPSPYYWGAFVMVGE